MIYREAVPTGAAREFVKCYWMLEDEVASSDIQRILPDGRCEMILNFGESFESESAGEWKAQPRWFVTGQITGPLLVRPRGRTRILGIRFHPHGAGLSGIPLPELTDKVVPLDELFRPAAREFEKLHDLQSTDQQLAALDRLIGPLASSAPQPDPQMAFAVRIFEQSAGSASIAGVANQVGVSLRQFQRRFSAAVGVTPKRFCRMQRFQKVFSAMNVPGVNWIEIAINCGYYDQSHLINDFREFAGNTPTSLLDGEVELARYFAR